MAQSIDKSNKRDKKRFKKKNGMRVSGRSVLVIQSTIIKRAEKAKGKNK